MSDISYRISRKILLTTIDTYQESGKPSFRISSVISQGIDGSSHEPDSSESWNCIINHMKNTKTSHW